MTLVLSVSLVTAVALAGGCAGKEIDTAPEETPPQIVEYITPQEAATLIQENQDNPEFFK